MSTFILILTLIYSVIAFVIYHKIFAVYYFDLLNGVFKELLACFFVGALLAGLTLYFSTPLAIIIIIAGIILSRKPDSSTARALVLIVFIVLAILIFVFGLMF